MIQSRRSRLKIFTLIILFFCTKNISASDSDTDFKETSCAGAIRDSDLSEFCGDYTLYLSAGTRGLSSGDPIWMNEVSCHFENELTAYIYQKGNRQYVDLKGFSGGAVENADATQNESLDFSDCNSLMLFLRLAKELKSRAFSKTSSHSFRDRTAVTILASENVCKTLSSEITTLQNQWKSEGRKTQAPLCIPQKTVAQKNPVLVRRAIQTAFKKSGAPSGGLMILGSDIPPFEIFTRDTSLWSTYYGYTDLPYGELTSSFWDQPLSKSDPSIRESVYQSKDFTYKMNSPTTWAFDINRFYQTQRSMAPAKRYRQSLFVSRWLSSYKTAADLKKDFRAFLNRRLSFKPFDSQRLVSAGDGDWLLFTPGQNQSWSQQANRLSDLETRLSPETESKIFSETNSFGLVKYLDQNTTFLDLSAHGQPASLGNFRRNGLQEISWLPPVVNWDACFSGAWQLEDVIQDAWISRTFSVATPPLAVVASQGFKFLVTIGEPDSLTSDVFLSNWKQGQSLGMRQRETLNENISQFWNEFSSDGHAFRFWLQLFSMVSVFGDPTVEL